MKDENVHELKEYIEAYKHKKRGSSGYYTDVCNSILKKINELEANEIRTIETQVNNIAKQCEELKEELKQSENVFYKTLYSFVRCTIKILRNIIKRIMQCINRD